MIYDKKEIMNNAWKTFKMFQKCVMPLSFGECLRRAWADQKKAQKEENMLNSGYVKMIDGVRLHVNKAVIACNGNMGYVVCGNTYAVRYALKKAGFYFDCEAKNWYTMDAKIAAYFSA